MPEISKSKILAGRKAVDAYREAHELLHEQVKDRTVHDRHTPLLEQMLTELGMEGFVSLSGFFSESRLLNLNEFGFIDQADFEANATEADKIALRERWQ